MGVVRYLFDGLTNALSGLGTTTDPRSYNSYYVQTLTDQQIVTAFRASWMIRKLITKPAADMTREWRDWQTDKAAIKKLKAEEKRLDIRAKVKRAEILRGLGGAGMVLYIKNDDPASPIDPKKIKAGDLTAVHVWHRSRFSLGETIVQWEDPYFGHPSYYEINLGGAQAIKFHPSRVVAFRAHEAGDYIGVDAVTAWWGDSTVQVIKEAVDHAHTAEGGFAALIKDARNRRLKIPRLTEKVATAELEQRFTKRVQALAMGESSLSITFLDGGDENGNGGETLEDRQMVWAGIPDIKSSFLSTVSAAGNMPETVFLGRSPAGMNATGKSDQQVWEDEVKGRQDNDNRPCLDQLDVVLVPSALGKVDDDITWKYAPLSTPTEKEIADTFKVVMDAVTELVAMGLIPQIALEKAVQNLIEQHGWLPGLDEALALLSEDERFPSLSEPDPADAELQTEGGDQTTGAEKPPLRRAANDARFLDATPRTMYVQRKLLNADDVIAWAKSQGFESTIPADQMHVTVAYSRTPIDWMTVGTDYSGDDKGNLLVRAGGPRSVERMGDGDAIALQFLEDGLTWRHQRFIDAGASWDWPSYQPHLTISWTMPRDFDVSKVVPYQGPLKFGPELFSEVDEDWKQSISEE